MILSKKQNPFPKNNSQVSYSHILCTSNMLENVALISKKDITRSIALPLTRRTLSPAKLSKLILSF